MYNRVLITTDGSESNRDAVDSGLELASRFGSSVMALCVFDVGSYGNIAQTYGLGDEREYMIKACEGALKYVMEKGEEMGLEVTPKIIAGHPAETIIEESKNYDLVVCGTLGKTGMKRMLLGSVAEKVVRMSQCPVLVCRNPVEE